MFVLQFLWAAVGHPAVLIAALVLVIGLAAYGYFLGLPALIKVLVSPAFWLAILLVVGVLGIASLKQENDALHKQVAVQATTVTASTDGAAAVQQKVVASTKRQAEDHRIQGAITNAQPGHAEDDAMDEIASIQANPPVPDAHAGALSLLHSQRVTAP